MIVKEFDYVKGNTVVKPNRRISESDKKYKELERSKRNKQKREYQKKRQTRIACFQIATLIFTIGIVVISRDNKVYKMQKELSTLNSQINTINDENEALRIELLKIGSLENIKTNAESKLGMSIATKDNTMQIEVPSSYFEEKEDNADDKNKTVLSKIMDAFSN